MSDRLRCAYCGKFISPNDTNYIYDYELPSPLDLDPPEPLLIHKTCQILEPRMIVLKSGDNLLIIKFKT